MPRYRLCKAITIIIILIYKSIKKSNLKAVSRHQFRYDTGESYGWRGSRGPLQIVLELDIVERHFFAKLNGTLQILLLFSLGLRDANVVEYTREFNLFIDSWHCQWTRTSSLARKPFAYAIRWLYYWPSDRPCSIWCLCVASWTRAVELDGRANAVDAHCWRPMRYCCMSHWPHSFLSNL